eukprot:3186402-Alexandrium_andersonii.AAC.1
MGAHTGHVRSHRTCKVSHRLREHAKRVALLAGSATRVSAITGGEHMACAHVPTSSMTWLRRIWLP